MTKKKPSEISELIYEAQDPIDETSDLDETDSNNFLIFLLTRDYQEEMLTDREMYLAIAIDFVKDLPYVIIGAACCLSTLIATDCLLLGSDNLNNQNYYSYIPLKEKAAICDTVIAPLQESMRNSCNQNNLDNNTHEVGYRHLKNAKRK